MHCPICQTNTEHTPYTFKEMMFGIRELFDYLRCHTCGTIYIQEIPSDMDSYYPDNYYSLQENITERFSHRVRAWIEKKRITYAITGKGIIGKVLHKKFQDDALASLRNVEQLHKKNSILDIGCGNGSLLYELREIGFTNTHGIDPYIEKDISYNNGLHIEKKELKDLDGTYDIIMLHHVFEHMANPQEILQQIHKHLNPEGTCIVRIPIADSYAWQEYEKDWVQLDPPRHFFLHTVAGMKTLAARTQLDITRIVYDSTAFQFWGSEQYTRNIALMDPTSLAMNKKSTLFTKYQQRKWKRTAHQLNQKKRGDQACFYLRKQKK